MAAASVGRSRVLSVPYYAQPTGITCQSTCLKMFASYIEREVLYQSTGAGDRDIQQIWKDVNEGNQRPVQFRNAHANLKWWLEKYFRPLRFEYSTLTDATLAVERMIGYIDGSMPVLVSVSHANVEGHIILVVGYEGYLPNQSTPDFSLIVHDPYGAFDPSLRSKLFGKSRFQGGSSLMGGGQTGPGMNCRLPLDAVSRQRSGDAQRGTFYLLSARR